MAILVTGGTGYIGAAVIERLRERGHEVAALVRSEAAARKIQAAGGVPVPGHLEEPATLAAAARQAGGVVHAAMAPGAHGWRLDRAAVEAMLNGLAGSNKPFVYTSGTWVMGSTGGRTAGEMFPPKPVPIVAWRLEVERMVLDASASGVRGIVLRPSTVWGRGGGTVARALRADVPLVGDGTNHWSFVHVDDLAELYALALERAPAGSLYVASHGPAVALSQLAQAAGLSPFVPLSEARTKIGPLADALVIDQRIGSTKAGRELGWIPAKGGARRDSRWVFLNESRVGRNSSQRPDRRHLAVHRTIATGAR
jgi:nucleoside-diphosphate-sugar epimerase